MADVAVDVAEQVALLFSELEDCIPSSSNVELESEAGIVLQLNIAA